MQSLELWQLAIILGLIGYVAVCFGLVARRYGRNPWLWGVAAVVSPVNLVILGYWAVVGRLPGSADNMKQADTRRPISREQRSCLGAAEGCSSHCSTH